MMKYFAFLILTLPAFGALSPARVKESALKHHPSVQAALDRMRAGESAITGAGGAFDARIVSDYRRQTKDEYRTTLHRTFLVKPLGIANSKVYAGLEQISNKIGRLSPVYNTGNPATTGQPGNYNVLGMQISLWKHLTLDPDRARLKNARLDSQIAGSDKRLVELDMERFGQLAYWEWVTARKVEEAFAELLKNGETRNDYLVTRSKKGDIAQILITENEQYVASRRGILQAARERLLRAEYSLALFYRNENGEPVIPDPKEAFEDYPRNLADLLKNVDVKPNVDELIEKRPDMRNLALNVERSGVDLELARQDLRPQIDLTTEYYQRTQTSEIMPRDYLMVMGLVSVPIERNLGNGNIAAARARQMVATSQMNLARQNYKFEVMALRRALDLRLEQVKQAEIEFTKAGELVATETYKFKSGGGNLYLVNLREQAKANAEASFHDARLRFMDSLLTYQAMVNTEI